MVSAGKALAAVGVLVIIAIAGIGAVDDDFAFDVSDDLEIDISKDEAVNSWRDLEFTAELGRIFHLTIPKELFGDGVKYYEVKVRGNKAFPSWLLFEKHKGVFRGLPTYPDESQITLHIKALKENTSSSKDIKLSVRKPQERIKRDNCPDSEDSTVLTLLIDRSLESIKPKQRIVGIDNLAKFFGLQSSAFTLEPLEQQDDITDSSVVLAGPGNIKRRTSKKLSSLYLTIGCDGKFWSHTELLVRQLKEQARDGTISEVLRLPLIGWRVKTETRPLIRERRETVGSGDYDDDDYYYDDDYEENYDDEDKDKSTVETTTTRATTVRLTTPTTTKFTSPTVSETHPHRHHHGELPKTVIDVVPSEEISKETEIVSNVIPTTTTTTTTTTQSTTPSTQIYTDADTKETDSVIGSEDFGTDVDAEEDDDDDVESETIIPTMVRGVEVEPETPTTPRTTDWQEVVIVTEKGTSPEATSSSVAFSTATSPSTTSTTTTTTAATTTTTTTTTSLPSTLQDTTIEETLPTTQTTSTTTEASTIMLTVPSSTTTTTTTEEPSTTPSKTTTIRTTSIVIPSTISRTKTTTTTPVPTTKSTIRTTVTQRSTTTEKIEYEVKNFAPTIQNRLKRTAVTAGKVFSYFIPEDTFTDIEDGTNLRLRFFNSEGAPIAKNSWCQFNPRTREIYGLPLEEDVSRWEYILEATDSEGSSVSDRLEILVQHHKARRVVNHEFSLYIRVENKFEFPNTIDWQLRTLRGLGSLYQISNLSDITVRHVNYTSDPVIFTWTNDSLPKSYCPKSDIDYLFSVLIANDDGDPSLALSQSLAPDLRVKKVVYHGRGLCDQPQPQPPIATPTNFSPIPRNQVDHINATVGELLIFRVPDDTFYDPEDGDARNLKMSLLTIDRRPLPTDHWLQFDSKNQEFYGIPLQNDTGHKEYQLICEDRGGLTANDVLVVMVHPAPRRRYNVDFSMTIETPYESFVKSASIKRKFVEKLRDLFKDRDSNNIHINNIVEGSTIVSWSNKSLARDTCPDMEIKKLRQVLVNDDETIADRVEVIMGPEFPVAAIALTLTGFCHGEFPVVHPPDIISTVEETANTDSSSDEYLITFVVPAVIIGAMLLLAGIVACVLYRRRRRGKMNVEDDERQSFRNKGIPVIFQDELEEKPEPGTKTPVILKEEKPPLAPPEYSKSGTPVQGEESDAKYQPPPPFPSSRENGRQGRPKPTPTYRKPPPYVPP